MRFRWLVAGLGTGLITVAGLVAGAGVPLFDGRTLSGWRAAENPASFRVEDGAIVCDGPRAHLFYEGAGQGTLFRNFELRLEVKAVRGANSGIFFHTRYQERDWPAQGFEVQVNNSQERHGDYLELKKTGSLYGIRNVHKAMAPDDAWFRMRVRVEGKRVRVWVGDELVVDYWEPANVDAVTGGKVERLGSGTFALQCHDPASQVRYRKLEVESLPDSAGAEGAGGGDADAVDGWIFELAAANFPVMDLHGHLKGGLTLEELLGHGRRTGIQYGVAVNCGLGFPVTNDAGALAFVGSLQGKPVFAALQGEGREWHRLVSRETRRRFDYVFTDAMTFTDARGRRTRLWIPSEVEVGDPEVFMDYYVDRIVEVLSREPIDVYVNPTFLPEVMAAGYDRWWTRARMERVVKAAKEHGVAMEINARYRIPSEAFIRLAKGAGVKFTFGTNNGDRELGRLEYCLEMQRRVGLGWPDMFVPGVGGRRADRE